MNEDEYTHKSHRSHAEHEHSHTHGRGPEDPGVEQEELEETAREGPHSSHSADREASVEQAHGEHAGHDHHAMMVEDFRRRFWISLILTVPILILSPMMQEFFRFGGSVQFPGDLYVLFGFSTVVFFYGGWPFLTGLIEELRVTRPGMMTLIGVAITTAYVYSSAVVFGVTGAVFFWELATLIDVMLLGHWIEMRSVMGASRALEELAKLMPDTAHRVREDGSIQEVPVGELAHEDRVLIKPGEKIPADGTIVEGESSVNEAMITGESAPVSKEPGQEVIGGSINGEGSLTVSVEKTGEEGYLSQVIALVRKAQESKSKTQNLANRAALWLTIVALGGGVVTLFVWTVLMGAEFAFALERTVTVMVIACPHALGLAIPLVVAVSTALSAQNGLLIRDRTAFETARNLQAILFDKTGTLTEGRFGVTDTILFSNTLAEEDLLRMAAGVEMHSEHPIARGIVDAVDQPPGVEEFQSIPGKGAQGRVDGKEVKVVSPGYLREQEIPVDRSRVDPLSEQGKTVVFVLVDGELTGAIALADIIRGESKDAIRRLKEMNIQPMMLTGDNKRVAQWVADQIGIEEYFAEVLPEEKADKVKEVQRRGLVVGMTGDGVNDAPALAQADVGIAVGAGTDVAVETADIILVRSNPEDVLAILELSRSTYQKMVQNLWWAAGYNIVAIPVAAGVLYEAGILLGPAAGAALMSLSTVIVAVNARLLGVER